MLNPNPLEGDLDGQNLDHPRNHLRRDQDRYRDRDLLTNRNEKDRNRRPDRDRDPDHP